MGQKERTYQATKAGEQGKEYPGTFEDFRSYDAFLSAKSGREMLENSQRLNYSKDSEYVPSSTKTVPGEDTAMPLIYIGVFGGLFFMLFSLFTSGKSGSSKDFYYYIIGLIVCIVILICGIVIAINGYQTHLREKRKVENKNTSKAP